MAHELCEIIDDDKHFVINPETREITSEQTKKMLMQGDHNSESFTFEVPRYVDGHDMSMCDKIEVHFNNISRDKTQESKSKYQCDILETTEEIVLFTWKISNNVTKYRGALNFVVKFVCLDDEGNQVYVWFTDVYSDISIGQSIDNEAVLVEGYHDILEDWKRDLFEYVDEAVANVDIPEVDLTAYATKQEVAEIVEGIHYDDEESLELVTETGLVQPVTSAAGEIFTDSTGAVYSI